MFSLDAELQQINLGSSSSLAVLIESDLRVNSMYHNFSQNSVRKSAQYQLCVLLLYLQPAETGESLILEYNSWCCPVGFCPVCSWVQSQNRARLIFWRKAAAKMAVKRKGQRTSTSYSKVKEQEHAAAAAKTRSEFPVNRARCATCFGS